MTIQCNSCGSSDVRPSHQSERNDADYALLGQSAYRCRDCRNRFYAPAANHWKGGKKSRLHHRSFRSKLKRCKRALINAAVFLVILGLFLLCLIYMSKDHPDAQASYTTACPCPNVHLS